MTATAAETEVMTYREALRLAPREELARDERVFVMGEEVGVFEGAYKVTAGLLDEFGPDRVRDTPTLRAGQPALSDRGRPRAPHPIARAGTRASDGDAERRPHVP